jgi:hypothetical protein
LGADRKRNAGRAVRAGKLFVVLLAAAFALAGCGASTETISSDVEAENRELRQENERLQGEVERL